MNKYKIGIITATSAIGTALVAVTAHAQVAYDTVFSATNAKDIAEQAILDNQTFVLYGMASVASLMIAIAWFKRISRGVAKGKVK